MIRYTKQVAQLSAIAAAVVVIAPAFAATAVDANAEFDTGYWNQKRGVNQGGRIETNISGKATEGDYFVAGRGTLILHSNGSGGPDATTDDSWVQFGNSVVDVKMVRFEAADLWPTPADAYRIGGIYNLNTLRGRTTYSDDGRFHAAITANVAPGTSVEVGIVERKNVSASASGGSKGFRPSVAFAAGPVSARLGFETGKTADVDLGLLAAPGGSLTGQASFSGFGGWVNAGVADGIGLRANFSTGKTKFTGGDLKRNALLLGVDVMGANISFETGKDKQGGASIKRTGLFGGYAMPLFGIKGATFQPVIGYQKTKTAGSLGTTANGDVKDERVGFRIHYDF